MAQKNDKNGPVTPPAVLGVQRVAFPKAPLISEDPVLWAVACHPVDHAEPVALEWYKTSNGGPVRAAKAVEELRHLGGHCRVCGQPFTAHRPLEAQTFAEQRQRDLAQARQEAIATPPPATPTPPTDAIPPEGLTREELEARGITPKTSRRPRAGPRTVQKPVPQARDPFEEEV